MKMNDTIIKENKCGERKSWHVTVFKSFISLNDPAHDKHCRYISESRVRSHESISFRNWPSSASLLLRSRMMFSLFEDANDGTYIPVQKPEQQWKLLMTLTISASESLCSLRSGNAGHFQNRFENRLML